MNEQNVKKETIGANGKLKFIALGGVEEIGGNCYILEHGKDILIIDMGFNFPEESMFGVDYLLPDIEYLKKRKDRIVGIVLTHAHLDHIGAIRFYIEELGFPPIYSRKFTIEFLREKLKEHNLDKKVDLRIVETKQTYRLKSFDVKFISVTHNIPQASSIYVKTQSGSVMYTGDFKFDDDPVNEPKSDYEEYEKVAREGLDLLCIDSTNIYKEGKEPSETEIHKRLDKLVTNAKGRVLSATFSSLGTRLYSLIDIAKKRNRKVVITGRSMKNMITILRRIGYIKVEDNIFLSEDKIKDTPDDKLLILATGTQGEEMAALSRMARGEHRHVKIKTGDTVILSSSVIPGNAISVQNLIDNLLRMGARVFHQSFMDVHTSGHGYQEDIKQMYELTKPMNVMPVHGYPSFLHEAAYWFSRWGLKKQNMIIPQNGQEFIFDRHNKVWKKGEKWESKEIFVEGNRVGVAVDQVLKEREILANNGIVLVSMRLSKGNVVGDVHYAMKGFVKTDTKSKFWRSLSNDIKDAVRGGGGKGGGGKPGGSGPAGKISKDYRRDIRSRVSRLVLRRIEKEFDKRPIVMINS